MTLKTILIPFDGTSTSAGMLEAVHAVARRFGAHMQFLHVRRTPLHSLPFNFQRLPARLQRSISEEVEEDAREQADAARATFEAFRKRKRLQLVDVPRNGRSASASWLEDSGTVSDSLVRHGRLVDLIAVSRPEVGTGRGELRRSPAGQNLESLLMESGRPVLVVPAGARGEVGTRIAIGWNMSAEAARAVAVGLPWLTRAKSVVLLCSRRREVNTRALAHNLGWHGIDCDVRVFESGSRAVGDVLLSEATDLGADLLVVGGYSRSRARQLLMGGVTRHLLTRAELPVLMAH